MSVLVAAVLAASGCASIPKPDSASDTILVVQVNASSSSAYKGSEYFMRMYGIPDRIKLSVGYNYIHLSSAGPQTITEIFAQARSQPANHYYTFSSINKIIILEEGAINVLRPIINFQVTSVKNSYHMDAKLGGISDAQLEQIKQNLSSMENFKLWPKLTVIE